jgi:hypothetical protein
MLLVPLSGCDRDALFGLFGYSRATLLKKVMPQDDESMALGYSELLRKHQFELVEDRLDPSIKNSEIGDTLTGMAELFPPREPKSIKVVDASGEHSADSATTSITLEYEFGPAVLNQRPELTPDSWLLARVVVQTVDGAKTITGFHVMQVSEPVEVANAFTFVGKGVFQYAGSFVAICILLFTLYAFVLCIRAKIGWKKWLFLIPILVGICRVTLNWTTGQWVFSALTVQLPPVMVFCAPYGPWLVHTTIPVGAIGFLLLRKRLSQQAASRSTSHTLDEFQK